MSVKQSMNEYEIGHELWFVDTEHGFRNIEINNAKARATISTYAGQVLSYRPATEEDGLLYLSAKARYQVGKAIRGGIPVCWPWFGDDPEGRGRPPHGLVRNRQWAVTATESLPDGATKVVLEVVDTDETRRIWPHSFRLQIVITVGDSLRLELVTRNRGKESLTISQALHAYFRVGDISRVRVLGLDGVHYLDKVDDFIEKTQAGAVVVNGEIDRIYTGVTGGLVVDDASLGRKFRIDLAGSNTAVVWNPWAAKAAAMSDLAYDDYRRLICVEAANAGPETVEVPGGGEYCLSVEYSVRR
jgi:glucose-6-phosphate 1-epimerase